MKLNRRSFVWGGLSGGASMVWGRSALATASDRVLVRVFLRGGIDGLNTVIPYTEDAYYEARPTISIPKPGKVGGAIELDGQFALHPALKPLKALYEEKSLAFVQAVGSPDPTRSHFDAQDHMEMGTLDGSHPRGWLASVAHQLGDDAFTAVSMKDSLPLSLRGTHAVAVGELRKFGLVGGEQAKTRLGRGFAALYEGKDSISVAGKKALIDATRVRQLDPANYRPQNGANYGKGSAASQLRDLAFLIKNKLGIRIATVEVGGWDTHNAENQRLSKALQELGQALFAFRRDLGTRMKDVLVLVVSEFGRTVKENGSGGTDHGHGTLMMALGGSVRGGKVYGTWPGLAQGQRYQGRDLEVTTDFRDVFSEVLGVHLGIDSSLRTSGKATTLGFLR